VLWDDNISPLELDRVAELAQLREFIVSIPNGYDTIVGDRGLELSGGQAQRIAIARAILRKPEVLVFDEATSALDNLTEKAVYEAIAALRPDSIVIVIAHRLSTIRDADQIIVLEGGNIVELGTHDSLIRDGGSYSKLYRTESVHG
jgi:ATP-binding cassette subfamily B protein